jgi:hypothetical protein
MINLHLYLLQCRELDSRYISGYLLELNIETGNFFKAKKNYENFSFQKLATRKKNPKKI